MQKFASGKNSVAIRWRSCWLQKITPCSFQNSLFTYCNYSLVTRCKIRLLLVGEVARCEKSRVTRCRSYSLIKFSRYLLQSSLVTLFRSCSLQNSTCHSLQNSLATRWRSCLLQNSIVTYCIKSLRSVNI